MLLTSASKKLMPTESNSSSIPWRHRKDPLQVFFRILVLPQFNGPGLPANASAACDVLRGGVIIKHD